MEEVSETRSQTELNRLRWRSRRGMAELDVLFVPFFEEAFDALNAEMKEVYARMLDEEDPNSGVGLVSNRPQMIRNIARSSH